MDKKQVKKSFAILLLTLFLLQCSMKTIVVSSFYIYQNKITRLLCENKSRPELHCNGKCFLRKQLKKQEKNEREVASILKQLKEFPSTFVSFNSPFSIQQNSKAETFFNYCIKLYPHYLNQVFHPPAMS